MVLEVRGLTKRFDSVLAVDDVSFSVERGETVGLVGPNGAGKTTTIHMILGLVTPTSGDIRILGRNPHQDRSILGAVNFSATYTSMPQTLTVRENLTVFARLYGLGSAKQRVDEVLEGLGVSHLSRKLTRHLSSGQATMAHIAKALLNRPRLLLLDEPTASLDPDAADRTRSVLRRVAGEEEMSLLVTSHNMRELTEMCDRIVFIHRGRSVAEGTPDELNRRFAAADLEEVFLRLARDDAVGVEDR